MTAYFDNSATTKPCREAVEAALSALTETWGNPSSLHLEGQKALELLKKARSQVAFAIGCAESDFYFTPSGTAANNTAIFGAYERLKKEGNRIVTTAVEHPSVLEPLKKLAENGVEVIRISPQKDGIINEDELCSAINSRTILVTCMAVNNEVGSVFPVTALRSAVKRSGAPALIHVDCVQAFGKIPVSPSSLGVDLLTVSGHKIHAPKGVGGLYIKDKNKIKPYLLGGGQEKGLVSGTEPLPAIAGFGAAAEALPVLSESNRKVSLLKERLLETVRALPVITVNSPENAIPYLLNLSVLGMPSQPAVNFLSENGICVSAGSACKKGNRSHVLTAMGLSPEVTDCAIRISLSRFTTEEEIDFLAEKLTELAKKYGKSRK